MADATYRIIYDASSANDAALAINRLAVAAERADAAIDKVARGLKALSKTSKGLIDLSASLDKAARNADAMAKSTNRIAPAANNAGKAASALNTAVTSAGRRMGTAASSAGTLATATANVTAAATAATPQLGAVGAAAQTAGKGLRSAGTAAQSTSGHVGTLINRAVAFGVVARIGREFAESMNEARDYSQQTAEKVLELRDAVRELRTTMGKGTTTDQATESVIGLMLASGADQRDAVAFDTLWESTIFAAKQKGNWQLDDAQTREAKVQSLRFATATGINAQKMAELVPTLGISEKVTSVDDVVGKLGGVTALSIEGVGNLTELVKVEQKLRGTMVRPDGGGATKSSAELMAIISAASTNEATPSAVRFSVEQAWREMSVANNPEKAETFKKLGIVPGQDDFLSSLRKMKPLIDSAAAQGKSEGQLLYDSGFHANAANTKIIKLANDIGIMENRVARSAELSDPALVRETSDRFRRENPDRFAKAQVIAADLERGKEMTDLDVMRKFAEAGSKRRHELDTQSTNAVESLITVSRLGGLLGQSGRLSHLDQIVREQAQRVVPGLQIPNDGTGRALEGEGLAKFLRETLSPAQRSAVFQGLEGYASGETAAAARPRGIGDPLMAAAPGGGPDPNTAKLVQVNQLQLDVMRAIADAARGKPGTGPVSSPMAPRASATGDAFTPRRS